MHHLQLVRTAARTAIGIVGLLIATITSNLACTSSPRSTAQDWKVGVNERNGPPASQPIDPTIAAIREEGLNRSQVMDTLDYLCDVIGQRLTGSPSCKRANEWTRDTLTSWGLTNAHLESWGPFGRGWEVKRFSMQVVSPYTIVLHGYPKAWSPGFEGTSEAPVVYIDATKQEELDKFKGKLRGAIVLAGKMRDVQARFEPLASRMQDTELEKLASAEPGSNALMGQPRGETAAERRAQFAASGAQGESLMNRRARRGGSGNNGTTQPTSEPTSRPSGRRGFDPFASRLLKFVADEGAALVITSSTTGDGGTFFVQSAAIPGDSPRGFGSSTTNPATAPTTGPTTRPRVWAKDAPKIPPQVLLAVEDYNRVARMIQRGESVKIATELRVKFYDDDDKAYNTIAEIPGTDLKDQIVMVGAHLDSWHSGTGATDNGVGSAAAMEAVRIIKALNLKPRRTIRVALWTGEEQGIYGSEAYVKEHFGHDPGAAARREAARARREAEQANNPTTAEAAPPSTQPSMEVVKGPDYDKLSVYFNLDNGTGKIRGIYAQNNREAASIFREWLKPFADLGARTVTLSNTGSTDHISFDQIGLPGFQFIQDPIEYNTRTHHSNEDVYDRIQADDMKQASTILAAFVWNAANMDERFPRKPLPTTGPSR